MAIKSRNAKMKQIAYPFAFSATLGIAEPAVFGVTLRLGRPFIMSVIVGVGIQPSEGVVAAPFDGEISIAADTKHAAGLSSPDGMEVLIHVGVDTAAMDGGGFSALAQEGQKAKAGERFLTFDRAKTEKMRPHFC